MRRSNSCLNDGNNAGHPHKAEGNQDDTCPIVCKRTFDECIGFHKAIDYHGIAKTRFSKPMLKWRDRKRRATTSWKKGVFFLIYVSWADWWVQRQWPTKESIFPEILSVIFFRFFLFWRDGMRHNQCIDKWHLTDAHLFLSILSDLSD